MIAVRTAALALGLALAGCGGAGSPSPGPILFAGRPENPDVNGYGWQLMVVNADGTGFRRLTRTDGDTGGTWSPDGTRVVFERSNDETAECGQPACGQIWIVEADGQNQRPLTSAEEDTSSHAWSPDGKRIAFSKRDLERETGEHYEADIYVMNPDGTEVKRLTDLAGVEQEPSWSPDGERIAFATETGSEAAAGALYVMKADGTELRQLTDLPGVEWGPEWSPDGEQIGFTVSREGGVENEVYVVNADGSGLQRLTDGAGEEFVPTWSPDGETIAFGREEGPGGASIVLLDADGSNERAFPAPDDPFLASAVSAPEWSPDGKQLAFTAGDQETIWALDADEGKVRKLWSAEASEPLGLHWAAERD